MEAGTAHKRHHRSSHDERLSKFDRALHHAKENGVEVRFSLACSVVIGAESRSDCVYGRIVEVDKYMILVETTYPAQEAKIWLAKGNLAGTEILS